MALKTREQILEIIVPLLKRATSPQHELSVTGGSLATLAGLDHAELFQGGKSAEMLRIAELEAELAEAKAAAAKPAPEAPAAAATAPAPVEEPKAPVVEAPVVEAPVVEAPPVEPPADAIDAIG
jgi:hypothetical protein